MPVRLKSTLTCRAVVSRPAATIGTLAAVATIATIAGGTCALLWACGPYFPNWLLGGERLVLNGPTVVFDAEIRRLFPAADHPGGAAAGGGAAVAGGGRGAGGAAASGSLAAGDAPMLVHAAAPREGTHPAEGTAASAGSAALGGSAGGTGDAALVGATAESGSACVRGIVVPAATGVNGGAATDGGAAMDGGAATPPDSAGAGDATPPTAQDLYRQTARIDCAELAEALAATSMPAARQREVFAAYAAVRRELLRRDLAPAPDPSVPAAPSAAPPAEATAAAASTPAPPPAAVAPRQAVVAAATLTVPQGLPAEFADYLEGAIAYRDSAPSAAEGPAASRAGTAARAAWQRLLARPAAARRRRSTWAAFMLGRSALAASPSDIDGAVKWFRMTRELAASGFADRLGLAAASLGWEGRAEADRKHYDRSLALYADQARAGDPRAYQSLLFISRAALAAGGPELADVARQPAARDALTALVLAHTYEENWKNPGAVTVLPDGAWLAAVKAAKLDHLDGADRLAWSAYRAGDFAGAAGWLEQANPQGVMTRWVRARLLLRDGKLAEAEALLTAIGRLPKSEVTASPVLPPDAEVSTLDPYVASQARALGEAGAVALARGEFTTALDDMLRGGYWLDAAYLGERVLKTEELRAYVDANWTADLAARPGTTPVQPEGRMIWSMETNQSAPSDQQLAQAIRYLLGRRLVREQQTVAAGAYLPALLKPRLDALAAATAAGTQSGHPAAERAAALFRAACITRHQGFELLGTEIEPDWLVFDGEFAPDPLAGDTPERAKNRILRPVAGELARAGASQVQPWKRFHYRYLGAELARQAAALLPNGSADKAGMLATAGDWLAVRDPAAAQPFYAALARCCSKTDLGREAASRHWLPKADTCPADTKAEPPADTQTTGAELHHRS